MIDETDFEGSIVLEKLAAIQKIEEFFEAVDSDDLKKAKFLMQQAQIDSETIAEVLEKIQNP